MARAGTMVPPPDGCCGGGCGSSHPHEGFYSPAQQYGDMASLGSQMQAYPQLHQSALAQHAYGTLMSTGPSHFGYQEGVSAPRPLSGCMPGMSVPSNATMMAGLTPVFVPTNQLLSASDAGFVGPGGAVAMVAPAGNFANNSFMANPSSIHGQCTGMPQLLQVGPSGAVVSMAAAPQDACIAAAIHSQLTQPGESNFHTTYQTHQTAQTSSCGGYHSRSHTRTDSGGAGLSAGTSTSSSSSSSTFRARQLLGHSRNPPQQTRRLAPAKIAMRTSSCSSSSLHGVRRSGTGTHSDQFAWLRGPSSVVHEVLPGRGHHRRHNLANPRLCRSSSNSALERAGGGREAVAGIPTPNFPSLRLHAAAPQAAAPISSAPATLKNGSESIASLPVAPSALHRAVSHPFVQDYLEDEHADFMEESPHQPRHGRGAIAAASRPQSVSLPRQMPAPRATGRLRGHLEHQEAPKLPPILVWRCKHPHGLFSMFSLALGHALTCEQKGWTLVVDWTDKDLLYKGPPGEPNVWNAFFRQPAELVYPHDLLMEALQQGRYMETDKHEVVFGAYRGVVQGYGSIPPSQATQGRELIRNTVALQDQFEQRLHGLTESLLPKTHRWLAVHIRRGDKAVEAKVNFDLNDEDLILRIVTQCAAWCCTGVFLCTDDAPLKTRLQNRLELGVDQGGPGLAFSHYPSALSADSSKGTHFDTSLDSYTKADDVMVETMLMARGCSGLLSTYSNVSAAAVYLSRPGYLYTTFWDPIGSCGVDQAVLEAAVAFMAPMTCSSEAIMPSNGQVLWHSLGCAR